MGPRHSKRKAKGGEATEPGERVACLLGAASEIVCALGKSSTLVARSHECKHPELRHVLQPLPVVSQACFDMQVSSGDLDAKVKELVHKGLARYKVDIDTIQELKPTLIIVQDQCSVCAVSPKDVETACHGFFGDGCKLLALKPEAYDDIAESIQQVAQALGCPDAGESLVARLNARTSAVQGRIASLQLVPVRVACLQWLVPLMGAGQWIPEMVLKAGGVNIFGESGGDTPQLAMDDLVAKDPEVIIVMCCGYDIPRALQDVLTLEQDTQWAMLSAVRAGRVFVADGDMYFNNSGPGYAESVEFLAEMLHPEVFGQRQAGKGYVNWPRPNDRQYLGQRLIAPMQQLNKNWINNHKDHKAVQEVPSASAAEMCREELIAATQGITERLALQDERCCVILSAGVDTCALMEAVTHLNFLGKGPEVEAAITVLVGPEAKDRKYAPTLAAKLGLTHHCLDVDLEEVLSMLPFCVRVLQSFDPMELRNAMVVALALHKAHELGYTVALTGDGSDELLGGYSFTWGYEAAVWAQKRTEMAQYMGFTAPTMGGALGVRCASPFLESNFIQWAQTCSKDDCVGEREIELEPGGERVLHMTGKVCLREAFPEAFSAWRRKDPIEVGSGSTELGKGYFKQTISVEEFESESKAVLAEDKVVIRDEEHLCYYRVFKEVFPNGLLNVSRWDDINGCIACGYQLKSVISMFCTTCGAYPATRSNK